MTIKLLFLSTEAQVRARRYPGIREDLVVTTIRPDRIDHRARAAIQFVHT